AGCPQGADEHRHHAAVSIELRAGQCDPRGLPARSDRAAAGRGVRYRARHGRVVRTGPGEDRGAEARRGGDRVTVAPPVTSPSTKPTRTSARVAIATINREEGDTGVHTHTRILAGGLRDAGVTCDVVSAFSGSKKWLPVFAVRPLLLHKVNKSWSTLWHRRWHRSALHENLKRYVAAEPPDAVVAQCPVSARAAMDVREAVRGMFPVAMV